jgi:hypothetical protein
MADYFLVSRLLLLGHRTVVKQFRVAVIFWTSRESIGAGMVHSFNVGNPEFWHAQPDFYYREFGKPF